MNGLSETECIELPLSHDETPYTDKVPCALYNNGLSKDNNTFLHSGDSSTTATTRGGARPPRSSACAHPFVRLDEVSLSDSSVSSESSDASTIKRSRSIQMCNRCSTCRTSMWRKLKEPALGSQSIVCNSCYVAHYRTIRLQQEAGKTPSTTASRKRSAAEFDTIDALITPTPPIRAARRRYAPKPRRFRDDDDDDDGNVPLRHRCRSPSKQRSHKRDLEFTSTLLDALSNAAAQVEAMTKKQQSVMVEDASHRKASEEETDLYLQHSQRAVARGLGEQQQQPPPNFHHGMQGPAVADAVHKQSSFSVQPHQQQAYRQDVVVNPQPLCPQPFLPTWYSTQPQPLLPQPGYWHVDWSNTAWRPMPEAGCYVVPLVLPQPHFSMTAPPHSHVQQQAPPQESQHWTALLRQPHPHSCQLATGNVLVDVPSLPYTPREEL